MMAILALTLGLILLALGAIHVYWFFGGEWGFKAALPTSFDEVILLNPRPLDCAIVAGGLLLLSGFYFSFLVGSNSAGWIHGSVKWIIPVVFLIRAVGDFKYVGLFKKVRSTAFAKKDRLFFTPLCLFLAAGGFVYALYTG